MKTDLSFLHVSALALLGTVAIVGFYMGRVAQRIRLPSVVGYMIFGVILGPSILKCKAKGTLTKTLYAIVGFDDGLAIIIFGFGANLAKIPRYLDHHFWCCFADHRTVNTLAPVFNSGQYDAWICAGQQPA